MRIWITAGWSREKRDWAVLQLFDHLMPYPYTVRMSRIAKKVTVNLPTDVLEKAQKITGRGITPTIIEGLRELERRAQRSALRQLRGKVRFELDLDQTRR
jgi:hypothetical protein